MKFLNLRGALLSVFLCFGSFAACADVAEDSGGAYAKAIQALNEGQVNVARQILVQMVRRESMHAGAWLDLALLYCALGDAEEAESLFAAIESRFSPPFAIREVIARQRAHGCRQVMPPAFLRVRAGRGVDSNANQGVSSRNLTLGTGAAQVELVLLPEYAPQGDMFTNINASFMKGVFGGETLFFANWQSRTFDDLTQFNLKSLNFGFEHPWKAGTWGLRFAVAQGLLGLGNKIYQTSQQLQLQATPPLSLPMGWQFDFVAGFSYIDYPRLSSFSSEIWEVRSVFSRRVSDSQIQLVLGYALDNGDVFRAGGDRTGTSFAFTAQTRVVGDVLAEFDWSLQNWRGDSVYSAGLIDVRREQRMQQLRLALIVPLALEHALHFEFRKVLNNENISLFAFSGEQLQINWQWQPKEIFR